MGFIEASKSYLVRWLNFKDRASRSEYWWGYLFSIIFGLALGFTWGLILGIGAAATGMLEEDSTAWTLLSLPPSLFVMIASLALSGRRMQPLRCECGQLILANLGGPGPWHQHQLFFQAFSRVMGAKGA